MLSYLLIIPRYFTLWTWIFFFCFPRHPMNMINSMISSVGGFYITYYYPRFLKVPELNFKTNGLFLYIIDLLSHHSLFLYQLSFNKKVLNYPILEILKFHLLFVFYFIFFLNPNHYYIGNSDIKNILIIYTIVFIILQRV